MNFIRAAQRRGFISQSPAELSAAIRAVPAEDICAAARRVRPDAVYTLEEV